MIIELKIGVPLMVFNYSTVFCLWSMCFFAFGRVWRRPGSYLMSGEPSGVGSVTMTVLPVRPESIAVRLSAASARARLT